ncbi:hypothetical protein [Prosthecobacter sp.]|uniref:hypothetical protein n=1 Tax=Prosthecobacter sp. TaxID=1965333 RepID=UPI0037837C27
MPTDLSIYGDAPFFVSPSASIARGLDHLGMAQDNFNLMDACIPGISNATRHVRPYSLMCWASWYSREAWKARNRRPTTADMLRFREKTESLFLWGHKLHDATLHMPGSDAKVPKAGPGGRVMLDFKSWNRSPGNTSYLAAVQYRPSLTTGLGLLAREGPDLFKPTDTGEDLAMALHAELSRCTSFDLLCDADAIKATPKEAEAAYEVWNVKETSKAEACLFRSVLYEENSVPAAADLEQVNPLARRSAFVRLVIDALTQARQPLDAATLRELLAFGRLSNGSPLRLEAGPRAQSQRWRLLQMRQAQRQAVESLLAWIERMLIDEQICEPNDLWRRAAEEIEMDGCVEEAVTACLPAQCRSFEDYSQWLQQGEDEHLSIIAETYVLGHATRAGEQTVNDCLGLLFKLERMLSWITPDSFLSQELARYSTAHRVPFAKWRNLVRRFGQRSPAELAEQLLKQCVLSQHFAIATQRNEEGKPRLRISVEEEGFRALVDRSWAPQPTPDRLEALLSLMQSCHLLRERDLSYSPAKL